MFRETPECFLILPHSDAAQTIQPLIRNVLEEQGVTWIAADTIAYRGIGTFANALERAHFIIADITDSNPNNLFELGIAYGLRKRVLVLSQKQTINQIPPDLGGQKIIFYNPKDIELLTNFIRNWVQDSVTQVFASPASVT
jgi:hypothetical protein